MTLEELLKLSKGKVEILSAHIGRKVPKKYFKELGKREISYIWSETRSSKRIGFTNYCNSVIVAFVSLDWDFLQKHKL